MNHRMPGDRLRLGKIALGGVVASALLLAAAGTYRRMADEREAVRAWRELSDRNAARGTRARFDPSMISQLPEPARRYFGHVIAPGARISSTAVITMEGDLSLGTRQKPNYQPMHARQLLSLPDGLVWRVQMGSGIMRAAGSDGMIGNRSWTRFWLLNLIPVARVGHNPDHLRSSFGRVVAEAAIWSPAALLPRPGIVWSAVDADTARATVTHAGMTQEVDIRVNAEGQPVWIKIERWSNANPQGEFRLQPFGGEVSDYRRIDGHTLPFRVDGGNFFGTEDYFPFYRARVQKIELM
jgi:hypothetical protein